MMKKVNKKFPFCVFIIEICVTYLSGCASTDPNIPYSGPYPHSFKELSMKNPLLGQEFGKLPEIRDGISDNGKLYMGGIRTWEDYFHRF